MYSRLLPWSRGFYLAGIVLALVLVIPTAWFPFQLAKVGVFALLLLVAAVCFVLGGGMREVVRAHGFGLALLTAALPLAYLVSSFFSTDPSVAWTGFGIETDTIIFTTLAFLAFMCSFAFFRTLRTGRMLTMVLFFSLIAAALFQVVSIIFGGAAIPFSTFADRSVNLVGKWNDLGILIGLLSVLTLSLIELSTTTTLRKIVSCVLLFVLAVLMGLINFAVVWVLVLVGAVSIAITRFLMLRGGEPASGSFGRLPLTSIAVALVAALFLLFGSTFNLGLTKIFPVSSLEVRPSYSSTLDVINASRTGFGELLVGTGPNTFGDSWLKHKPTEVNQSVFWSLDFNVGFSTFLTALGTVGLLGLLGWLMPLFLVLAALLRAMKLGVLTREDRILAAGLSLSSLFLIAATIFYVPSQNIVLLAFVLSGATFAFLWRQGRSSVEEANTPAIRLISGAAGVVLVLLAAWVGIATDRRLIAEAYVGHGTQALSQNDTATAEADASRAVGAEATGDSLRFATQADLATMQQIAGLKDASSVTNQQRFATVVQHAISTSQRAATLNPVDYRPVFTLAQVYDYLSTLGVQGAAQSAGQTYLAALQKDPTNPAIPLSLAHLAAQQNDAKDAVTFLQQSLTLKSNYTDAILLVVQLDVANKDIPSAIKAATAAAQTAPGVAPIWFELGLLYYSANDAKDAAAALQQAVSIQSDYANAKYFLGLSEYALGDTQDAIKQFSDLVESNSDNAEVKLILSNMQSGKQPFAGETPAPQAPQQRSAAPVSE